MPYSLRVGTLKDRGVIAAFQSAMAFESEKLTLNEETVSAGVLHILNTPSQGEYWLVENNSTHKVLACMLILHEWSDWRNGTVLWIHSLYVEPSSRKKGLFRALYAHQKSRVESDPSLRGIRLYVEKNNLVAQSAYRRVGMTDEHYDLFEWLK